MGASPARLQDIEDRLGNDPEARFEVKPGVINYPGELIHYPEGPMRASFRVVNRGLMAIDWVKAHDPGALQQYPFQYTGHYADPFPEFYRSQGASSRDTRATPA